MMADPYVRDIGIVEDINGVPVGVGVDYDVVTIGDWRLTHAQAEEFAHLFVAACWEAGRHARLGATRGWAPGGPGQQEEHRAGNKNTGSRGTMNSTTLTPAQRAALTAARNALDAGEARRRQETGEFPGNDAADLAYWAARYRKALETLAAAFAEDAS